MKRRVWWTVSAAVSAASMASLWGCSPTLDWREIRPQGSGITLLFPCRPDRQVRRVRLAAEPVPMELRACTTAEVTWGLAFADVQDPARVGPALVELRAAAASNLRAAESKTLTLRVEGATPNPASLRVQWQGQMPDGRAVTGQLAVFAKGTRVFQATVLGERLDAEAVDTFFDNLRLVS